MDSKQVQEYLTILGNELHPKYHPTTIKQSNCYELFTRFVAGAISSSSSPSLVFCFVLPFFSPCIIFSRPSFEVSIGGEEGSTVSDGVAAAAAMVVVVVAVAAAAATSPEEPLTFLSPISRCFSNII
ncbi:hypothetical protein V8G54_033329 [Vigna mungo]|uniref:Uncharacterized protein n=1 Tax=Vigna mungo TaxID=3915 RepID=A0AAQ3RHI7_VIGMU